MIIDAESRFAEGSDTSGISSESTGVSAETRYFNREVSWLEFNSRVLALAEDTSIPALERAKFLAIASGNLDEFFQVRVAGLREQVGARLATTAPDGMSPPEQLREIRTRVLAMVERMTGCFNGDLLPRLARKGVTLVSPHELSKRDQDYLTRIFEARIFPVLTPLAVDPAHPFPYISNLSLNLAVLVRDPATHVTQFARIKVPPLLARFLPLADGRRFVALENLIAARLEDLFPGMEVVAHHPFRVTRNADLALEEDGADDLLAAIETELRRQRRSADVVRLEVDRGMTDEVLTLLLRELELEREDVYVVDGMLDLAGLWELQALDRPELKDEPWTPVTQPRLASVGGDLPDLFKVISEGDVMVHLPYESFTTSVEAFIEQAARDPRVLAIKQTLYRTSGPGTGIMASLVRAAEAGKQVVALVELKARGDEQRNIAWARVLEEAGVHVVYGLVGLKTHAKLCLVLREEAGGIRHYAHIGTGNYNPRTALSYEDFGLFTADGAIGSDLTDLFNLLTGYSRQRHFSRLLIAPVGLRAELLELIRGEAEHEDGRITLKLNSLVDAEMIDALYEASSRGVRIDLVVRGICCLRPGVAGLSDNIQVRSIVGRYLEHSRIFRFGSQARGYRYYIGSADLMPRNLDRRVEALTPVLDAALQARLGEVLSVNLDDDALAWTLGPDGAWSRIGGDTVHTQHRLQELALARVVTPPIPG
ncbi:MAG: polyphosphate kinase 1 [Candidatus Dormibacteria bacterium]